MLVCVPHLTVRVVGHPAGVEHAVIVRMAKVICLQLHPAAHSWNIGLQQQRLCALSQGLFVTCDRNREVCKSS